MESGSSDIKNAENGHVSPDDNRKLTISPYSPSSGEEVQLGEHNAQDQKILQGSGGCGSSPSAASPNRIPSSVFARTSNASLKEWSVASNESLFSIQMGNASFSREQLNWMTKSGELGYINGDQYSPFSGPLEKTVTPTNKESSGGESPYGVNAEASAAAAETMMEVLKEKECQQQKNNAAAGTKESPHLRSLSQHSDASVKSFAFPILTGDSDKSTSSIKNTNNKSPALSQPSSSSTKTTLESTNITQTTTPETPKPQTFEGTPKPETLKLSQTPKTPRNACQRKWFSCFSCCSPSS